MRKKKQLLLLVYFIFLFCFIYLSYQGYRTPQTQTTTITLVLPIIIALISLWVAGLPYMIKLIDWFLNINRTKLIHSKILVEKVIGQPVNNASLDYENDEIKFNPIKWAQPSALFECVKLHLKDHNYRNICENYIQSKEYANRIHNDMVQKVNQYREMVAQKLDDAKLNLTIRKNERVIRTGEYSQKRINHLIFYDILEKNETGNSAKRLGIVPISLALPKLTTCENYFLEWFDDGGDIVAEGDYLSVEHLQNVIEKVEADEELEQIIIDINSLKTRINDNVHLELFKNGIQDIIKQVEYKNKPLYGECDDSSCD